MKAATVVASFLGLATLAAIAFAIVYATGAQTQAAAAALGIGLASLAVAMVVWEHELIPRRESIEERGSLASEPGVVDAAAETIVAGARDVVGRRPWLVALFATATGALGVAILVPLRSFFPKTSDIATDLSHTSWRAGARLVREDGSLVRANDLDVNGALTVFPEGHVGPRDVADMANDATVLVRVPPSELALPAGRAMWAPGGLLAYSKVCTHAGCPVGLYRAAARQLFCPCHQSTFDVLTGGTRVFGPAARGLPQLPLGIGPDGTVHALGDFPEPIGPEYWERA